VFGFRISDFLFAHEKADSPSRGIRRKFLGYWSRVGLPAITAAAAAAAVVAAASTATTTTTTAGTTAATTTGATATTAAATTTVTAAAGATAATTTATAVSRAFFTWASFVHTQRAAHPFFAIKFLDRCFHAFAAAHGNKAETAWAAAVAIHDHGYFGDVAVLTEQFADIGL